MFTTLPLCVNIELFINWWESFSWAQQACKQYQIDWNLESCLGFS